MNQLTRFHDAKAFRQRHNSVNFQRRLFVLLAILGMLTTVASFAAILSLK